MRGSWAGAMGHTQWMPEVWLNVGFDYDGDGRVSPFGRPDDALGSTARYLVNRGKYHRNEHWGYEVAHTVARERQPQLCPVGERPVCVRADGKPFPQPKRQAKLWVPVAGGPAFLLGPNFFAVSSYNPSMNYALAICHLGDRILGAPPSYPFSGSERALTLAEVQEIQTRLTKAGFNTGGNDGRVGNDTMKAIHDYQTQDGAAACRRLRRTEGAGQAAARLVTRMERSAIRATQFYDMTTVSPTDPDRAPRHRARAVARVRCPASDRPPAIRRHAAAARDVAPGRRRAAGRPTKRDAIDNRTVAGFEPHPDVCLADFVGIDQLVRRQRDHWLGIAAAERARRG